jgi:hypothetical protein
MKKIIILVFLAITITANAQEGKYVPFKLIVLKPEKVTIDSSFDQFKDSIVQTQTAKYYRSIKNYEDMANCKTCDFEKEDIERYKNIAAELKKIEPEVKKFKYFEMLSAFSSEIYNFYFNEYDPYSMVTELPYQNTSINELKLLAEARGVDYIIFFSEIHTVTKNKLTSLMLTTSVFSKKENKVILNIETSGDTKSRGEIWACTNPLNCLFTNAVRTSTNEVSDLLRKLQVKNNPSIK